MYQNVFKRILDILGALIILPFLLILIIIIGLIIVLSDQGPIFYNAPRLGKNGKTFYMYKFRSMKVNAPDIRNIDGSTYNASDDPRVTGIGKFLRKSSLDEVPQILNVLKGDMSFVGPRPDLPEHEYIYDAFEKKKLEVLPGITGYNQAYYRNSIPWKQKLKNDVYYVENISFIFDVKIFWQTIKTVIFRENIFIDSIE